MQNNLTFHIAIVANSQAGNGLSHKVAGEIAAILAGRQIAFSLFVNDWPAHFEEFSEVWIAGGDGTLNFFINRYPGIEKPLAIFKGGTGNDFATALYGPCSVAQQVALVLSSEPRPVDAGYCNERLFLNVTGIGFDGEVLKGMGLVKKLGGSLGYFLAIVKEIFFFREPEYKIEGDGFVFRGKLFLVMVANSGTTGGGFKVSPLSSASDGLLDLVVATPLGLLKRLFYLPRVKKGEHMALPMVTHVTGTRFLVECDKPTPAQVDGELVVAQTFMMGIYRNKFLFRY